MLEFKPIVINLGFLTITPFGVSFGLAVFLFFYLSYLSLYREYKEDVVVNYSLISFFSFVLGGRLVYGFLNLKDWGLNILMWFDFWHRGGISYLGGFLFYLLTTFLFANSQKINCWHLLEKSTEPFLISSLIVCLGLFLTRANTYFLVNSAILLMLLFLVKKVLVKYRSFAWYPSGKTGFIFLVVSAIYFLLAAILDFSTPDRIYWQVAIELAISVICGLVLRYLAVKK